MKTKTTSLVLSILMVFVGQSIFGQSSWNLDTKSNELIDKSVLECIYNYTVNASLKADTTKRQSSTYTVILQANTTVSKFWDWHSFKKDSIIFTSNALSPDSISKLKWEYYFNVENLFTPIILKNYLGKKYTVADEVTLSNFTYTEQTDSPKWELSSDTLTVCGYLCHKAVTKFGGKLWNVWYAPDIIISAGPWKLDGLPGLILKARDSSNIHTFEATVIRNSNRPIYWTKNMKQITINKKQYFKEKKYFELLDVEDIISVSSFNSNIERAATMNLGGKRLSLKRNTVYCPLEE